MGVIGKFLDFICLLLIFTNIWIILVINYPFSFLRGTRHLHYP